jgi:hypothetical protein
MGNLLTSRVGNILTALLGKVLTVGVGKVLDIYNKAGTLAKLPHRRRLLLSLQNQRSTRFSQELDVGVKWRWN